jgi:hypothetical protein
MNRVQRATALEHGSGGGSGRSFGRNRSGLANRSRGTFRARTTVGTIAARAAIAFGTGATVGTVAARTAIAFGTGATVGTVAARAAIAFGTGTTVGTVAARTAITFGTGATVGTVAARAAIAFGTGTAVGTVAAIFAVAFGTGAAVGTDVAVVASLAVGTGQVAQTVLEVGRKLTLLAHDGIADFAEDGLDLEEDIDKDAESGGLEEEESNEHVRSNLCGDARSGRSFPGTGRRAQEGEVSVKAIGIQCPIFPGWSVELHRFARRRTPTGDPSFLP